MSLVRKQKDIVYWYTIEETAFSDDDKKKKKKTNVRKSFDLNTLILPALIHTRIETTEIS